MPTYGDEENNRCLSDDRRKKRIVGPREVLGKNAVSLHEPKTPIHFEVHTRDQPLGTKPPNWNANVLTPGDTFLLNCPLSKAPRGFEPDRPHIRSKPYRLLTDCMYSRKKLGKKKVIVFARTGCTSNRLSEAVTGT